MKVMYLNSAFMGTTHTDLSDFYLDYLRKRWAHLQIRSSGEVWKSEFKKYKGWPKYAAGFIGHSAVPRFDAFVVPDELAILERGLPEDHLYRFRTFPENINTWVKEHTTTPRMVVNRPSAEIVKAALTTGREVKMIGPGFDKALKVDWVKYDTTKRFNVNGEEYDAEIGYLYPQEGE